MGKRCTMAPLNMLYKRNNSGVRMLCAPRLSTALLHLARRTLPEALAREGIVHVRFLFMSKLSSGP